MEFNGTFEIDDTTTEEVWLALSDPALVASALPGCEFLVRVDSEPRDGSEQSSGQPPRDDADVDFDALREEYADRERELTADPDVIESRAFEEGGTYAALVQISVGPVNPTFETVVTVEEREFPEMTASGEGSSGDSSFEMSSSMTLSETEDDVAVDWRTEADVFGRVAQMGQRVVNPVANRVVKKFFSTVQQRLRDLEMTGGEDASGDGENGGAGSEGSGDGTSDDRSLTDRLLGRSEGDET